MAKMHQLLLLAFVLGYAWQAQGTPIEDKEFPEEIKTARNLQIFEKEDDSEQFDSLGHPEKVDTLALGRSHPEKVDKLALGRAPYSYHKYVFFSLQSFYETQNPQTPKPKNIVTANILLLE